MLERVAVDLTAGREDLRGGMFRYDALGRVRRCTARRSVRVLAFGFDEDHLRLVLEGEPQAIQRSLVGVKVGTVRIARGWGVRLVIGPTLREPLQRDDLHDAVLWAHRGPQATLGPLSTPWSSHRDLMGYRTAPFFDPADLAGRVDPGVVHRALGGGALPGAGVVPPGGGESLSLLLRVAGGVLGVLPADRRCFRLFVHLARARGWRNDDIARALVLTVRRIRQLAAASAAELALGLQALSDPRLRRVP